jgi:hypothetical protein
MVFNQATNKKIATAPTLVRSFDELNLKTREIEAHVKIGGQDRKVKLHLPMAMATSSQHVGARTGSG